MRTLLGSLIAVLSLSACTAYVDAGPTDPEAHAQGLDEFEEVPPIDTPMESLPFVEVCVGSGLCGLVRVDFEGQRPSVDLQFRERDRSTVLAGVSAMGFLAPRGAKLSFLPDRHYAAQRLAARSTETLSQAQGEQELDDLDRQWWQEVGECAITAATCVGSKAPTTFIKALLTVGACTVGLSQCVNALRTGQKIEEAQEKIENAQQEEQQPPPADGGDSDTGSTGASSGGGAIGTIGGGGGGGKSCGSDWECTPTGKDAEECVLVTRCD